MTVLIEIKNGFFFRLTIFVYRHLKIVWLTVLIDIKTIHLLVAYACINFLYFIPLSQLHPLGLCSPNDYDEFYDYGWVGVVKLEPLEFDLEPCLSVFGKVGTQNFYEIKIVLELVAIDCNIHSQTVLIC